MVFGFGKKKTSEQPIAQPKEKTILLSDISKFLEEIESPQRLETMSKAKSIRENVMSNIKGIHDIILQLEQDDLKLDEVDKNLRMVATRGKNSVVSTIKKETSSSLTNVTKYEDVVLLAIEINQILKRAGDVLGVNSRIIHIFAKKYADNLKEEIAKMASNRNLLSTTIHAYDYLKEKSRKIEEDVKKISNLKISLSQENQRISEIDAEVDMTKNHITELEGEINGLKSMEEYKKFLEIKSRIDSLSTEKKEIKNKIDLQFSKISRPLGKYSYISSLERPVKKIMEELIREPFDVISQQTKNTIIEILQAVAKSVLSGSISVKDTQRAIEQIEETISRLDEFLQLKESYSDKVSNLQSELIIFDIRSLESKEHELQKVKMDIVNLESIKKKIQNEIIEHEIQLKKLVSEMESSLSSISKIKLSLKLS